MEKIRGIPRLLIFLLVAFFGGWGLQAVALFVLPEYYNAVLAVSMVTPLLGVWIASGGLKREKSGISWKLKGKFRYYLLAWLAPAVLMAVGAVIYFFLFPGKFEPTAIIKNNLTAMPLTALILLQGLSALTLGPAVNTFFAVGEESGWRGMLTPALSARFGEVGGKLLSGIIWGVWHFPIIILAGYEYGTGYWGAPIIGCVCMCVFTMSLGVFLSFLYEKTGSIWTPALCHGALNAIAAMPLLFLPEGSKSYLLGPTIAGPIAGVPLIVLAVFLLSRKKTNESPIQA